jgi:hypothetical protein
MPACQVLERGKKRRDAPRVSITKTFIDLDVETLRSTRGHAVHFEAVEFFILSVIL